MGHVEVEVPVVVDVAGVHAHSGLWDAAPVDRGAGVERSVLEASRAEVHPHLVRRTVVRDVEIQAPITVQVGRQGAEAVSERGRQAGAIRRLLEPSTAEVA